MNRNYYEKSFCLTISKYGDDERMNLECGNLKALERVGQKLLSSGEFRITVREISRYYGRIFGRKFPRRRFIEKTKILGILTPEGIK